MNRVISSSDPQAKELLATLRKSAKGPLRKKAARTRRELLSIGAGAAYFLALGIGAFFLSDFGSDWFLELSKPVFFPPPAVFLAVGFLGLAMLAVCFWRVILRSEALVIRFEYLFQGAMQLIWQFFLFRIHAVFAALIVLLLALFHSFFLLRFTREKIGKWAFLLLAVLVCNGFFLALADCVLLLN